MMEKNVMIQHVPYYYVQKASPKCHAMKLNKKFLKFLHQDPKDKLKG